MERSLATGGLLLIRLLSPRLPRRFPLARYRRDPRPSGLKAAGARPLLASIQILLSPSRAADGER
eukprot:1625593-Pyramimonas_sp.AAC.1